MFEPQMDADTKDPNLRVSAVKEYSKKDRQKCLCHFLLLVTGT